MVFQRFLKPKWQHSNPETRRQAVLALSFDAAANTVLCQVAREDSDAGIRKLAVNRLQDMDVLRQVMSEDQNQQVQEQARKRLGRLLAGLEQGADNMEQRQRLLQQIQDEDILIMVLRQAREAEMRLCALAEIKRESLLGDMAIEDEDAEVRMAAAQRLNQTSTMSRVAKKVRSRDKKVYQYVQEKLDQIKAEQERPQRLVRQAKEICKQLETLAKARELVGTKTYRDSLQAQWQEISISWQQAGLGQFDADLTRRYETAVLAYDETYAKYLSEDAARNEQEQQLHELMQQKQQLCSQVEDLIPVLENTEADLNLEETGQEVENRQRQWHAFASLPNASEREFQSRFNAANKQVREFILDRKNYVKGLAILQDMQGKLERRLHDKRVVTSAETGRWQKKFQSLPKPKKLSYGELEKAVSSMLVQLYERQSTDDLRRQERLQQFKDLIETAEKALSDGNSAELSDKVKRLRRLEKTLQADDVKDLDRQQWRQRLSVLVAELSRMRDWQRWAGTPHKAALASEMQALAAEVEETPESVYDYVSLAKQIQTARDEWKRLGEADPAVADELWEQFNDACNRAYQPCESYFQQQGEQRQQNKEKKELICQMLEKFIDDSDWSSIDWRKVENVLQVADEEWRQAGTVNRKDYAGLNKSFRASMDVIRQHLSSYRRHNKEAKEALLNEVQQLLEQTAEVAGDSPELRQALSRAKELQQAWKNIGPSNNDGKLWKKFRAANDTLFGRKQAHAEAQKDEQDQNYSQCQSIVAEIGELAKRLRADDRQAEKQFALLRKQWDQRGPVPRAGQKSLERQYRDACRDFNAARQQALQQGQLLVLKLLDVKNDLCRSMETLSLMSAEQEHSAAERESLQTAWSEEPALPDQLEMVLQSRFQQAVEILLGAATSAEPVSHMGNRKKKENLCIRMEILAGVETPAQYKKQRMDYQLSNLAERMRGEQTDTVDDFLAILLEWYAVGVMADSDLESGLYSRFQEVRNQLMQQTNAPVFKLVDVN